MDVEYGVTDKWETQKYNLILHILLLVLIEVKVSSSVSQICIEFGVEIHVRCGSWYFGTLFLWQSCPQHILTVNQIDPEINYFSNIASSTGLPFRCLTDKGHLGNIAFLRMDNIIEKYTNYQWLRHQVM